MLRSPVLILVLVLALIAAGLAWLLLRDVEPPPGGAATGLERTTPDPGSADEPELAGRPTTEAPGVAEREAAEAAGEARGRVASGRTLEGHVRAADGSGVAGAAVHLRIGFAGGVARHQVLSDRAGRFEFTGLAYVGLVSLAVDAGPLGRALPIDLPWRLGQPFILELDPPEATVNVRVTLLEERGAEAVPRANEPIRWRRDPVFWDDEEPARDAATDTEGRVLLALPVGALVTFEAPTLPPNLAPRSVPPWTHRVGDVPVDVELRVVPRQSPRRVRITGRVVDPTGAPVPGAAVGLANVGFAQSNDPVAVAWTLQPSGLRPADGSGRFIIECEVASADAAMFARAPGLVVDIWTLPPPPADLHEITLRLKAGATLVGRVVDDEGAPVPSVRLEFRAPGRGSAKSPRPVDVPPPVLTGPDGSYRVDGLAEREHFVFVTTPEGTTAWPPVFGGQRVQSVGRGETRAKDLVLQRGGTLSGIVVDEDGTPVANVHVRAWSRDRTPWGDAWSDAAGMFEIRGLARGATTVSMTAPGFLRESPADVTLPTAGPHRIVLARGVVIRGRVLDAEGRPIPRAVVWLNVPSEKQVEGADHAVANGSGNFVLPAVRHGGVRLLATAPGYAFRSHLLENMLAMPEIRALAKGSLAGQVLDQDGRPVPDVDVTARPVYEAEGANEFARAPRTVRTDAEGRFGFSDLYLRDFLLDVSAGGTVHVGKQAFRSGAADVVLRLPGTR